MVTAAESHDDFGIRRVDLLEVEMSVLGPGYQSSLQFSPHSTLTYLGAPVGYAASAHNIMIS